MGCLALVLILLLGCIGQEAPPEQPEFGPQIPTPSTISLATAPAPVENLEGITDILQCEDRDGNEVQLQNSGNVLLLVEDLTCFADILLYKSDIKTFQFDLTGSINFDVQFYTSEVRGHSQMNLKPFTSGTGEFIYDTSRLLVDGESKNRKEGAIQHALATRNFLQAVGKTEGVLELELFTHEAEAQLRLEIDTLSEARKLTKSQAEGARSLLQECCKTGSPCAKAAAELEDELEKAGDLGANDDLAVELCRSPFAICRKDGIKAWLLDSVVSPCSLGKMLWPFKDSLESLSCNRCSFGQYNDLESLAFSLKGFDNLHDVHLAGASLSGTITCDWGNFLNLRVLDLDDNPDISGNLPSCFSEPDFGLLSLSLQGCSLKGGIQALPNIRHLYIGRNAFKGKLDSFVSENGNVDRMLTLHARENGFSGPLPQLPSSIRSFDVSLNNFVGEVPEEYSGLEFLVELQLQFNSLNGALPELPPSMEILEVNDNDFSGVLPDSYSKFTNLKLFHVQNNKLTGLLPPTLPETLEQIDVSQNGFTGRVPSAYSNLPEVQYMTFFSNNLVGPLPEDLFENKPKLKQADLSNNKKLGGPLPTVWEAPELAVLRMQGCALEDSIPKGLGALPMLSDLRLSGNTLSGKLDDFADGLAETGIQLETCFLGGNYITGSIPIGFNKTMTGEKLDSSGVRVPKTFSFSSTQMEGPIPQFVLDAVLDLRVGGGKVVVVTSDTLMQCPSADDLPSFPSIKADQTAVQRVASFLNCFRDGEQISVANIYAEEYEDTPSDDIIKTFGNTYQGPAPPPTLATPPSTPLTTELAVPPPLLVEQGSEPDIDSRSTDVESLAGEAGEAVEGEGVSGDGGNKESGGGTDGGVVAAAVLVPLTVIVLVAGGYICYRRSSSRFQRFEAET